VSVKRRDLVRYTEKNGYYFLREGSNHTIYTNKKKTIPIKRHRTFHMMNNVLSATDTNQAVEE